MKKYLRMLLGVVFVAMIAVVIFILDIRSIKPSTQSEVTTVAAVADSSPQNTSLENEVALDKKNEGAVITTISTSDKNSETKTEGVVNSSNGNSEDNKEYSSKQVRDWMYRRVDSEEKIVFLTFDDGPSVHNTPKILDILKANNIKATFYYYTIGDLQDKKDVILRMFNEGHSIGLHSNSHTYDWLYPNGIADPDFIVKDLNNALRKIRTILPNFDTKISRFPGGSFSWKNMEVTITAIWNYGVDFVDWNTMTGDSDSDNKDKSPEGLVNYLKKVDERLGDQKVKVVLMHDADWVNGTAESLQGVIDYYRSLGYRFAVIK